MFDIAWSEFMVVAVVALVVVGPRDLPALLRTVGKTIGSIRRMAGEFQGQFNEAMREAELDELRREVTGLKDHASKLTGGSDPFRVIRDELKSAIDSKPAPSALAGDSTPPAAASETPSALAPAPEPAAGGEPPAPATRDFVNAEPPAKLNGAAGHAVAVPKDEPTPPAQAGTHP
jgi:sec-independent protein translocase protein TatB